MARACPSREDLTGVLLGALDRGQERRVSRHLARCADCQAEVRWLQPAVDVLSESVEQVEPPPELRARLLAEIREEASDPKRGRRLPRLQIGGLGLRPIAGLAVLALLGAGLAGYLLNSGGQGQTQTDAALVSPPLKAEGGSANLETDDDSATLIAQGMPSLKGSAVYQVWVRRGAKVAPSSYFVPDSEGTAAASVPEALDGADAVMVTEEPRPARAPNAKPTSPVILDVELNS